MTRTLRFPKHAPLAAPLLALGIAALLSGCDTNGPHSVAVGAYADDYRTNHPIVIGEKDLVLDLPVAVGERGMTVVQRARLDGFLDDYDRSAAPILSISAPAGSVNATAASYAARDFMQRAMALGVPRSRIAMLSYESGGRDGSPPVRLGFTAIKAHTDKCGRWPGDLSEHQDNKHYANFGCSMQNNLAAQVANPTDLLGPRKRGEIDAENRKRVIDTYQARGISEEFLNTREVDY